MSEVSYEKYKLTSDRLSKYLDIEYSLTDITISKIDIRFIEGFYIFLREHCNYCNNTAMKHVQRMSTIMRYAERLGLVARNPFIYFRFKFDQIETSFLSQNEVRMISEKKFASKRLEQVRDIFIFSCFTGLSFADICDFRKSDIYATFDNNPCIVVSRTKTNIPSHIPILPIAQQIIDKYASEDPDSRLFPVKSNQKTNEYLKEIADLCGINKPITFHTARHTFAVLMLDYGVSIESLSRMMGHNSMKSTMVYARITDRKINDEMNFVARKLDQKSE